MINLCKSHSFINQYIENLIHIIDVVAHVVIEYNDRKTSGNVCRLRIGGIVLDQIDHFLRRCSQNVEVFILNDTRIAQVHAKGIAHPTQACLDEMGRHICFVQQNTSPDSQRLR